MVKPMDDRYIEVLHQAESHPYDTPWAIVQNLRKDVADLKAMLRAEQQQRATEVQNLRSDLATLTEAFKADTNPLHAGVHKLTQDLDATASHFSQVIEEIQNAHRQHLGQLNSLLQDEIRTRKHCEDLGASREVSRTKEWKASFSSLQNEVSHQKQVFLAFKDEQVTDVNNLAHDVELIMTGLMEVSQTRDALDNHQLFCFSHPGSGNGSKLDYESSLSTYREASQSPRRR